MSRYRLNVDSNLIQCLTIEDKAFTSGKEFSEMIKQAENEITTPCRVPSEMLKSKLDFN